LTGRSAFPAPILTLPAPLLSYDKENEAQMRRDLMIWAAQFPRSVTAAIGTKPSGFGFSAGNLLIADEILGFGIWPTDIVFTTGDVLTEVKSEGAATGSSVINIETWVSGAVAVVGTITFAAAGTTATVAWTSSPYTHPAFTIMQLHAPNPADATLSWITGRVNGVPA